MRCNARVGGTWTDTAPTHSSAAADGLFLHPAGARDQEVKSVNITYGAGTVTSAARKASDEGVAKPLEAHGVVGRCCTTDHSNGAV